MPIMTTSQLTEAELGALRALDTPTVYNTIEMIAPERQGFGYTVDTMISVNPALPPLVGYAKTATIRSMRPSAWSPADLRKIRLDYFRHIAAAPNPGIAVIQDLDGANAGFGSFWGEVTSTALKSLGCIGGVTDGSIRDVDAIVPGFQILARKVVPSRAYIHLVDFACEVNVTGMVVQDGDLIHADRHGAIVIPHELAREIPKAAELVARKEKVILDAARQPGFTVEKLEQAMVDSGKLR
jgi:regulator of RNase E activity RraA